MKQCSKCREIKDPHEFHKYRGRLDGLNNYCKTCNRKYAVEHREQTRQSIRACNWRRYGITITEAEFDARLKEQGNQCAICYQQPDYRLAVDHDHETGKVRGLLCKNCNRALGYLKDSVGRFESAINYLRRNDYVNH